jgi:hypothetical protein
MNRESEIFLDIKKDPSLKIHFPPKFITAAVLVVALSGSRKNTYFMTYKSFEYKVLTVLSKILNMNSLIKLTVSLSNHGFKHFEINFSVAFFYACYVTAETVI